MTKFCPCPRRDETFARLPRSTVLYLQNYGIEAVHVGGRGLATTSDSKILDFGNQEGMVIVTLDADFHTLLALSGLAGPSVIRIRIESLLLPVLMDWPKLAKSPDSQNFFSACCLLYCFTAWRINLRASSSHQRFT